MNPCFNGTPCDQGLFVGSNGPSFPLLEFLFQFYCNLRGINNILVIYTAYGIGFEFHRGEIEQPTSPSWISDPS
jgi:hypothetical protein